jgi:putative endopeptidase
LLCSILAAMTAYTRAGESVSDSVDLLLSNRDLSVSPGSDFFQYATGGWFARNPIPAGEVRWGIGRLVRNQLDETLRAINETAAKGPRDEEERLIGDFWASAMNEDKLKTSGFRPLAPQLAQIANAKNQTAALDVAFELIRLNVPVLVGVSVDPDRRDSRTNILYFTQVPLSGQK